EVSGIAGVIDGVFPTAQDIATVAAMRVLDDAGSPVAGGDVGYGQPVMAVTIPPVELHNIRKAEIGDQVEDVMRNHDDGAASGLPLGVLHDGPQRGSVQVIKMGVCNQ